MIPKVDKKSLSVFTILVVEDEESLRESIVFDVKRHGFSVLSAENGLKAFEYIKSCPVHLVLSDIQMPECDGLMLLEKIQSLAEKPPVVFITGYSDFSEEECLQKGAYRVFSKPYDRKQFIDCIMTILTE